MVLCVRVPKSDGNPVRISLKERGLLDITHRIGRDGDSLLIPVTGPVDGYEMTEAELEGNEHRETDYRMLLPEWSRSHLPTSYDCIGDVIVVKIPEEVSELAHDIGDALLRTNSNVRLVLQDGGVKGELRVRELHPVAGDGPSETRHRASGVTMLTDPATVYFNPRLATERMRVASNVKEGEVIIDMFAGVAPFPMVIARHAHPSVIYSIDLNPDAYHYMKENIRLNRTGNVIPILGDALEEIRNLPMADRVIMNLPQIAYRFLPDALAHTKEGGVVHLHTIRERATAEAEANALVEEMNSRGLYCRLDSMRELKTYSPTSSVYVLDVIRTSSSGPE